MWLFLLREDSCQVPVTRQRHLECKACPFRARFLQFLEKPFRSISQPLSRHQKENKAQIEKGRFDPGVCRRA
jgi:hypothetical protein